MTLEEILGRLGYSSMDLYCQAQISILDGSVNAVELLLRAERNGEAVPPPVVVEHARRLGLGAELGLWSARRSLEICTALKESGTTRTVRLNLMEAELGSSDFISGLIPIIQESGVEIEVVESARLSDFSSVATGLRRLRAAGIKVWMDDFSKTHEDTLRLSMPGAFHGIKIDRSILIEKPQPGTPGLVEVTESFASLGYQMIVEGIETLEDLIRVRGTRALEVQGYYLHRPESCEATIGTFRARHRRSLSA